VEIVVLADAEAVGRAGAEVVERVVRSDPACVLGLATGRSPLPAYEELVRRHRDAGLTFSGARAFLLDEYVGLPAGHPGRLVADIRRQLLDRIDLPPDRLDSLDGTAPDLDAECGRLEAAIEAAGGVDLQLLGVGGNGHIAFNEPGSPLGSRTRVVSLTARTRADNGRSFEDRPEDVPAQALTQGVGTVLDARRLLLIATGLQKADPVARALEGPVTPDVPASAVQLHRDAIVLLERQAAAGLRAHS